MSAVSKFIESELSVQFKQQFAHIPIVLNYSESPRCKGDIYA